MCNICLLIYCRILVFRKKKKGFKGSKGKKRVCALYINLTDSHPLCSSSVSVQNSVHLFGRCIWVFGFGFGAEMSHVGENCGFVGTAFEYFMG